jgi:hypothetical protein
MGKNDRDVVARRELAHALEALADGAGHVTWGPGHVITRLSKRALKEPAVSMAVEALEAATMASHDLLGAVQRDDALPAIRALAPVFLDLIIAKDERAPKPAPNPWRKLFPVQPITREQAHSASRFEQLARAALSGDVTGLRLCPVIAPPKVCIGCGLRSADEPSVLYPRSDGFPRCSDCWREVGGL